MARFQALTNSVLDEELESLRERLGLAPSEKAELLREVSALAAWVVRQVEQGRTIEARRGRVVEPLSHPVLDRLRHTRKVPSPRRISLTEHEAVRLAKILSQGFRPPPALRRALASLGDPRRHPPLLRWKKSTA